MSKPPIKRDWSLSVEKVKDEDCRCRNCGTAWGVEQAHVVGREHDRKIPLDHDEARAWVAAQPRLLVAPSRIIPLCGPATSTDTCHGLQHAKRLDCLPLLSLQEQIQAVADAGGIQTAYQKLTGQRLP